MAQRNVQSSSTVQTPFEADADYEERARTIIHGYAAAASHWVANVSRIPIVGNFGVMFGSDLHPVSALTTAMIIDLAKMFDRGYVKQIMLVPTTHFVGTYLGVALIRSVISFIPVAGSVINANLVLQVTEVMGWTSYLIFQSETNVLKSKDKKKFHPFILRGIDRAEKEMGLRKRVLEQLTSAQQAELDELAKKLYKNVAPASRRNILDSIEELVGSWRIETVSSEA